MNLTFTIIISLVASVIGGVISGLFVMRKFTCDAKRLYARQMQSDFNNMSLITIVLAAEFLSSLGYKEVEDLELPKPGTRLRKNLALVNRIQDEHERNLTRKFEAYETQTLVKQVGDLTDGVLDEMRVTNFLSRYLLQSTYFDGLAETSSAVESLKYWDAQIPKRVDDTQIRICVSNIARCSLKILDGLLKADAEIDYYSNAKSWTWRLSMPIRREGGTLMNDEDKKVKIKSRWWRGLWGQLLVLLGQVFFGVVLSGIVLYVLAQYKMENFQPFELAMVTGLLGGFPLVAGFANRGGDEIIIKRLKTIGGLYLFAAIFFVVFGFYQAADQAGILPSSGRGAWMFEVIYVTTFYLGAIALAVGMWMSLEIVPRFVGLGGVRDRVRIIFGKRNKVKRD